MCPVPLPHLLRHPHHQHQHRLPLPHPYHRHHHLHHRLLQFLLHLLYLYLYQHLLLLLLRQTLHHRPHQLLPRYRYLRLSRSFHHHSQHRFQLQLQFQFQVYGQLFADGSLWLDQGTIYIIENSLKRPFTSMNIFLGMGYSLRNVVRADLSSIRQRESITVITRHPRGSLIDDHGTIYFVGTDFRYPFPSAAVFLSWGNQFKNVVRANSYDLAMPIGPIASSK
jgi:hypothetical protein